MKFPVIGCTPIVGDIRCPHDAPVMGGHWTPPVMPPIMGGATYHFKQTSNIDIYPSTLFNEGECHGGHEMSPTIGRCQMPPVTPQ